jgi:hypothetical protein
MPPCCPVLSCTDHICEAQYTLCIRETVCDGLFVRVIRERWRETPASTHHSITCRAGKEYRRKEGKLMVRKFL